MLTPFRSCYLSVARMQGYSLTPLGADTAISVNEDGVIACGITTPLYLGADICCAVWRMKLRLMNWIHRSVLGFCPPRVRTFLRNCKATLTRS
jgi:hypothetical protein